MGKCIGMFGVKWRYRGCGKVWGRCERVYGVSVKGVLKWGKVFWDAERCGDVGGAHTLFYTFTLT